MAMTGLSAQTMETSHEMPPAGPDHLLSLAEDFDDPDTQSADSNQGPSA